MVPKARLINTGLEARWGSAVVITNRFNGLSLGWETVETVPMLSTTPITPLKRGVNENLFCLQDSPANAHAR
jgi:hypothetical protein